MSGTLFRVTADQANELRLLAGDVMWRRLHAYMPGKSKMKIARVVDQAGVSRSTLYKVKDGVEGPRDETYWAIAGTLDLPTHIFEWIIAGDVQRIKQSPGIPDDLRHYIVTAMGEIELPRNRRATDRRPSRNA